MPSRSSLRRAISATANSASANSAYAGPRHSARASANATAAVSGSPVATTRRPDATQLLERPGVDRQRLDVETVAGSDGLQHVDPGARRASAVAASRATGSSSPPSVADAHPTARRRWRRPAPNDRAGWRGTPATGAGATRRRAARVRRPRPPAHRAPAHGCPAAHPRRRPRPEIERRMSCPPKQCRPPVEDRWNAFAVR